jgi:release factor glutamine methyltransferase
LITAEVVGAIHESPLQPEITFEPRIALDGGADGLDFFRRIIQNAHTILKPKGFIFFEIGLGQVESIRQLFDANGFENFQCFKDDSGINRIVSGELGIHG